MVILELNDKTQQDFLNREWVQRLLDAGVDMSDAKYCIYFNMADGKDYISLSEKIYSSNYLPTYTVSELFEKLPHWIYPTIEGVQFYGHLQITKSDESYMAFYNLKTVTYDDGRTEKILTDSKYLIAEETTIIEALAELLIKMIKNNKYEGNYSKTSSRNGC